MNPFKYTYKIIESSNLNGDTSYLVKYGNLFSNEYLTTNGTTEFYQIAEDYGGKLETLAEVKNLIKSHEERLLAKRLSKVTTKTIARI